MRILEYLPFRIFFLMVSISFAANMIMKRSKNFSIRCWQENDYEGNEQKIEIEDYESYNIENLLTRYWKAIMRHYWNVEVLKDFQRQEQLGRQIQHKLSFLNQLIYKLASVKKEKK